MYTIITYHTYTHITHTHTSQSIQYTLIRQREVRNSFRDKQRSTDLHCEKMSRVVESVSKASSKEESEDVLFSHDVVESFVVHKNPRLDNWNVNFERKGRVIKKQNGLSNEFDDHDIETNLQPTCVEVWKRPKEVVPL